MKASQTLTSTNKRLLSQKTGTRWKDQEATLRELLLKKSTPFIVKYVAGDLGKYLPKYKVDSAREVTLHILEICRHQMITCRRVLLDTMSQEQTVSETTFDMSSKTEGWFEVQHDDGKPMEYYGSICDIASSETRQVLVRTAVVGYHQDTENGEATWLPCEIKAGETLTIGEIFSDTNHSTFSKNMKNILKRLLKQGKVGLSKSNIMKYLQTFDSQGKEIMIPLVTNGIFSPINTALSADYNAVYNLSDLLLAFRLPVTAQIVKGHNKSSSTLKLESVRDVDRALITVNNSSDPLEIPLDNDLLFYEENVQYNKLNRELSMSVDANLSSNHRVPTLSKKNARSSYLDLSLPTRARGSIKLNGRQFLLKLGQRKSKKEKETHRSLLEQGIFTSKLDKTNDLFIETTESDELQQIEKSLGEKQDDLPALPEKKPKPFPKPKFSLSKYTKNKVNPTSDNEKKGVIVSNSRSLPPIPTVLPKTLTESPNIADSSETIYEHLPSSPSMLSTPVLPIRQNIVKWEKSDDGYLAPSEVLYENDGAADIFFDYDCYDEVYENPDQVNKAFSKQYLSHDSTENVNDKCNDSLYYSSAYNDVNNTSTKSKGSHDLLDKCMILSDKDLISYSDSFKKMAKCSVFDCRRNSYRSTEVVGRTDSSSSGEQIEQEYRNSEALSDTYIRGGNDSAISLCSRSEHDPISNYPCDISRYNMNGWIPPCDLSNLSVAEVSKSLRYIGMKDRIVIRFAYEQIDGTMLCSLDEKLLSDGFSDLNALEIKKIVKFVAGWRPKK